MSSLLQSLLVASMMMTLSYLVASLFVSQLKTAGPRLRQGIFFCVLLQGVMLVRLPVELPWLASVPDDFAVDPVTSVENRLAPRLAVDSLESAQGYAKTQPAAGGHLEKTLLTRGNVATASPNTLWRDGYFTPAILALWMTGFVALVLRSITGYLRLCFLIRKLTPAPDTWSSPWAMICAESGYRTPEMYVSAAAGPMLVRTPTRYVLVVPKSYWDSLTDDQRRGVLLHEFAHLQRHDVWRQSVARLAAALHWWNPAAWWCVHRYEESSEWACDQQLTQSDPTAAHGLALSLVRLIEWSGAMESTTNGLRPGIGVQSMAAPPVTNRVKRLLAPSNQCDSIMKRFLLAALAGGLLALSMVQFDLVAADSPSDGAEQNGSIRVLSAESQSVVKEIRERLDSQDKASADLNRLLETQSGQIAFAGVVDLLKARYREQARGEAIPRFFKLHFETTDSDQLSVRDESRDVVFSWVTRSEQLGQVLDSMQDKMSALAERINERNEVNRLARRMLTDEHVGFAIMLDQFDGQSDPIELFLNKTLSKLLVQRGNKSIVIPTLPNEGRRQLERFEIATKVAERLMAEMPDFAKEFATPDPRHKRLVSMMSDSSMAAVTALHLTKEDARSPSSTTDRLFEQLEHISRDTADGLVIEDAEAWTKLEGLMDLADRIGKRVPAVRAQIKRVVSELDTTDDVTRRFASELSDGVIAYQVAADIPYADFDLGKQVHTIHSQVMEPAQDGSLNVREDAKAQVTERAEGLLTACRTIRRYLRRIDTVRSQFQDQALAESLDGAGRMLLLTEVRKHAERSDIGEMDLLLKEFFVRDDESGQLRVHAARTELIGQLESKAKDLEEELGKDDF